MAENTAPNGTDPLAHPKQASLAASPLGGWNSSEGPSETKVWMIICRAQENNIC